MTRDHRPVPLSTSAGELEAGGPTRISTCDTTLTDWGTSRSGAVVFIADVTAGTS
jgi:hypothetical protein